MVSQYREGVPAGEGLYALLGQWQEAGRVSFDTAAAREAAKVVSELLKTAVSHQHLSKTLNEVLEVL